MRYTVGDTYEISCVAFYTEQLLSMCLRILTHQIHKIFYF